MAKLNQIFNDRASLVLREMLADPDREWVVREFESELGIGRGWAAHIIAVLRKNGFLKGVARGRLAGATLRNADALVERWTQYYSFDLNDDHVFYTADSNPLPKLKTFFAKKAAPSDYALTNHTGANLLTHHVNDMNVYLYLNPDRFDKLLFDLRVALDLKELKQGGNVHAVRPKYKRSVFHRLQRTKGYSVVSNLQLYLDLYNFPARGREHAEYLARQLKEEGRRLA